MICPKCKHVMAKATARDYTYHRCVGCGLVINTQRELALICKLKRWVKGYDYCSHGHWITGILCYLTKLEKKARGK